MKKIIVLCLFVLLMTTSIFAANGVFAVLHDDEEADLEYLQFLISKGADVNEGKSWGCPPLIYAIHYCKPEIVKTLLATPEIDVNILDDYGNNALLAELTKDTEADYEIIKLLLEKGIDVNVGKSWGYPPLIYSLKYCDEKITYAILNTDQVDVNTVSKDGEGAILCELEKDGEASYEMIQALMAKNMNPELGEAWGYDPLSYAKEYCSPEIFEALKSYTDNYDPNSEKKVTEIDETIWGKVRYAGKDIVLYVDGTYKIL